MIVGTEGKGKYSKKSTTDSGSMTIEDSIQEYINQSIETRDFSKAITYIDFVTKEMGFKITQPLALWQAYSLFHLGEYQEAIDIYKKLLEETPDEISLNLCIATCEYYLQDFETAEKFAQLGPECDLKTRILFQIAFKLNKQNELFQTQAQLIGTLENQLTLASIHFAQAHYSDALDIFQRLIEEHPDYIALNVYIGMCLFKLDRFDESNDACDMYLSSHTDSAVTLNLKSCDYLRIYDAQTAESQILQIQKFSSASYSYFDNLLSHNLCVFHGGDDGFKILPKLINILPEAKYNLAILYMRQNNPLEAENLMHDFIPLDIQDTILKASVSLGIGQLMPDDNAIVEAKELFMEIGHQDVVKDTVPGRECLASALFLSQDYEETLRIFQTIEEIIGETDEFNYDKAMTLASLSRWAEAERYFLLVKNPLFTKEIFYVSWLCRCYIKNLKPDEAWELYIQETQQENAKTLLQIIANDCYLAGMFYHAMKAYDILSKCDDEPSFREGLIASSIGLFKNILSRKDSMDKMNEIITVLSSEPDAQQVLQTIVNYMETSGEFDNQEFA